MKNVTLIGASGFVGTALLNELLARGHKVTAIVRNPERISASSPDLNVVKADVADTGVLVDACKGKDASSARTIRDGAIRISMRRPCATIR